MTIYSEGEEGHLSTITLEVEEVNIFAEEIRHFIDCLNSEKTPIEDAVTIQRMLEGIYISAARHEEVKI